jgi:hypothetical protein
MKKLLFVNGFEALKDRTEKRYYAHRKSKLLQCAGTMGPPKVADVSDFYGEWNAAMHAFEQAELEYVKQPQCRWHHRNVFCLLIDFLPFDPSL